MDKIIKYYSEDMFPSLVIKIPNFLDIIQCKKIVSYYEKHECLKTHSYFIGNAKISHNKQSSIINDIQENITGFNDLVENVNSGLKLYANITGFCETFLTNSWINFQNKGSSLYNHTHANSTVTGCIYLNVSEESSPLSFQNPNPFVEYTDSFKETNYSMSVCKFYPLIGDLFIFPSWIKHGSNGEQNMHDNRVSIAFNTNVK